MMLIRFLPLFLFISLPLLGELPEKLVFNPQPNNDYLLEDQDSPYGKVVVEAKSHEVDFRYTDLEAQDQALAFLEHDNRSIMMDVVDENLVPLGKVTRSTSHFTGATYLIYDPAGKLQGKGDLNMVGTRITIRDPKNRWTQLATFSRPNFKIPTRKDCWCVTFQKMQDIDPRVFIMVGTLQAEVERTNSSLRR